MYIRKHKKEYILFKETMVLSNKLVNYSMDFKKSMITHIRLVNIRYKRKMYKEVI